MHLQECSLGFNQVQPKATSERLSAQGEGQQTGTWANSVPSSPPAMGLPTLSTSTQVCSVKGEAELTEIV